MDLLLFLAVLYGFTFFVGRLINKLRVPWVFAAMLLGAFLSFYNPFTEATSSDAFLFLAELGMYFMLFLVGFELDIGKMKSHGRSIVKATLLIIFLEAFLGTLFIRYVFGTSWFISFLVAMSFATVGEAILDEFKMINTKLGQMIIGIGTLDDIIEVLALALVILYLSTGAAGAAESAGYSQLTAALISIAFIVALTAGLSLLKKEAALLRTISADSIVVFLLSIFFLFVWIGEHIHAGSLSALLAGIALKNLVPAEKLAEVENRIKTLSYSLFAPAFFVWVGVSIDIHYIFQFPILVLLITLLSKGAKILGSIIVGRKELGIRQSVLMGIGLSVRFSTSIVIIKILYENSLIGLDLYSVLIASSMVFKFIVPVLFANLMVKWVVPEEPPEEGWPI